MGDFFLKGFFLGILVFNRDANGRFLQCFQEAGNVVDVDHERFVGCHIGKMLKEAKLAQIPGAVKPQERLTEGNRYLVGFAAGGICKVEIQSVFFQYKINKQVRGWLCHTSEQTISS